MTDHVETEAERQSRLAREADARDAAGADRRRRLTLEGLADVDAGRLINDEAMQAWADSLGTDQELPIPQPHWCGFAGPRRRGPILSGYTTSWRRWTVRAAARAVQSLRTAAWTLLRHDPRLGARVEDFAPREVRRLFVDDYELRYEIRGEVIIVVCL
jgi:predicted transcriptional regulator/plasmid stabilization system protein ParE